MNKKAFTLVELLVVIAILGILASVTIVGYSSFIEKTYITNVKTELTSVKTVLLGNDYFDDKYSISNGTLTYTYDSFDKLIESYSELENFQDKLSYSNGIIRYDYDEDYYGTWNLSTNVVEGYKK